MTEASYLCDLWVTW